MSGDRQEQWSPSSWPVSFRWRVLASAIVLAATVAAMAALSHDGGAIAEVPVVAAAQRWAEGYPPGDHTTINMPADLAVLFVHPSELADSVSAVEVPEGTLVSPKMLRPRRSDDRARTSTLMRFAVADETWPDPGPAPGDRAVFSPSPGGCAAALVTLLAVTDDSTGSAVTIEATPELAAALADEQWWIWESPPGGWPECVRQPTGDAEPSESQSEAIS